MRRADSHYWFWFFILVLFSIRYANAQHELSWAGTGGTAAGEKVNFIANDDLGNSYIAVGFNKSTTLYGQNLNISKGEQVLVKLNAKGAFQWMVQIKGLTLMDLKAGLDHVYLCGGFADELKVSGKRFKGVGFFDGVLLRFDAEGKLDLSLTGNGKRDEIFNKLDIDADGNIYATGAFTGESVFNKEVFVGGNKWNYFLIKYDTKGEIVWKSTGVREEHSIIGEFVSVNKDGSRVFTFGELIGASENDPAQFTDCKSPYACKVNREYLIMGYNGEGKLYKWKTVNAGRNYLPVAIDQDENGNLYYSGFECNSGYGINKMDEQLNTTWSLTVPFGPLSSLSDMKVSDNGDIYTTGSFNEKMVFPDETIYAGVNAVYLTRFNSNGDHTRTYMTCEGNSRSAGIALNSYNELVVAGTFQGKLKMGDKAFISSGEEDVFISKWLETREQTTGMKNTEEPKPETLIENTVPKTGKEEILKLKVTNSAGEEVFYKEKVPGNKANVDLSGQPKGVYHIQYYSDGELLTGTIFLR
jgi:hypothetical protein